MYFCHILYFLSFCPKCRLFIIEQIFVIYSRNKAFYRKFHKIGNVYLYIAKSFRFIVFVSCFYIKDIFIIFGLYVSKSLYFFHAHLYPSYASLSLFYGQFVLVLNWECVFWHIFYSYTHNTCLFWFFLSSLCKGSPLLII